MSMFEMSDEAAAEFGQKLRDLVTPEVNEKATLVGIGVKDDPVSQEMIAALRGAAPEVTA
jgi:hypothetical protein